MWLSKQAAQTACAEDEPAVGTVSMAQQEVAAVCDTERRNLLLLSPGYLAWRPQVGEQVLVMKDTVLGLLGQCPVALAPGECCLYAANAFIHLTHDGQIRISGNVSVNGTPLEDCTNGE